MIIEIDISQLIKLKINAHQYLIAKLMLDNQKVLEKYTVASPITPDDTKTLVRAGVIEDSDLFIKSSELHLTKKWKDLHNNDNWFEELLAVYPKMVIRPDGSKDFLHINPKLCKKQYLKIVGNDYDKHRRILNALFREVSELTKRGKLGFMTRLPKWIAAEGWLAELAKEDEVVTEAPKAYGTELT